MFFDEGAVEKNVFDGLWEGPAGASPAAVLWEMNVVEVSSVVSVAGNQPCNGCEDSSATPRMAACCVDLFARPVSGFGITAEAGSHVLSGVNACHFRTLVGCRERNEEKSKTRQQTRRACCVSL